MSSAMYGLKYQARCIKPLLACEDAHRFVIGTMNPREQNEVHVVEFNEDTNQVELKHLFSHGPEIWHLEPSPADTSLIFTGYYDQKASSHSACLWKMDMTSENGDMSPIVQIEASKHVTSTTRMGPTKVVWNPVEGYHDSVMVLDNCSLRHFKIEQGSSMLTTEDGSLLSTPLSRLNAGCWDPHHSNQFVAAVGDAIHVWDVRNNKSLQQILNAHSGEITDVDYNPNKPYHIVTGSKDRSISIWDLRHSAMPLKKLQNHTHWVSSVKYNRFHDQLILSAGADSTVNLWKVVSISSAPLGDLEDPLNEKEGDTLIQSFDEHEDSVYATAWSCYDAWILASLSYDGRVVVNHVPKAEKYKILL